MFDEAHRSSHLDRTLSHVFSTGLHLPTSTRATQWSNLGESDDDDDLLEVDDVAELRELLEVGSGFELGELETEVGARSDVDGLKNTLSLETVHDLELGRVVAGDGTARFSLLVDAEVDASGDLREASKTVHAATEIGPDRLDWVILKRRGCMRPRMLKAISLAEKVRTPCDSTSCATMFVASIRPVPRVHLYYEISKG